VRSRVVPSDRWGGSSRSVATIAPVRTCRSRASCSWSHATSPSHHLREQGNGPRAPPSRRAPRAAARKPVSTWPGTEGISVEASHEIRESAELVVEGCGRPGRCSLGADSDDRAERPDRCARDEEGEHEPANRTEGRPRLSRSRRHGDERGGATCPLGHESRAHLGQPRSGEDQPHHDEQRKPTRTFQNLAAVALRLAGGRLRSTRAGRCPRRSGMIR